MCGPASIQLVRAPMSEPSPPRMYRPPHKRARAAASTAPARLDDTNWTGSAPVSHSGRSTVVNSTDGRQTVAKYEPPHQRASHFGAQGQRSYSAMLPVPSRLAESSTSMHRLSSDQHALIQRAHPISHSSGSSSQVSAVPSAGAASSHVPTSHPRSGRPQATADGLLTHRVSAAHSNGTTGQPDILAAVDKTPSLLELLQAPLDMGVRPGNMVNISSGLSTIANEQLNAKPFTNGQQKAGTNGQQTAHSINKGQLEAKLYATHEGQLEFGDGLVQRPKADLRAEADANGQSKADLKAKADINGQSKADDRARMNVQPQAEQGPSTKATHSIGMLLFTFVIHPLHMAISVVTRSACDARCCGTSTSHFVCS